MPRLKANATRAVIILAVIGFLFSSVSVTVLYLLESKNQQKQQSSQQQSLEQLANQNKEPQDMNEPLDGYSAAPFDKATVTELKVEELKAGEGAEATESSTVKANYFGWTSDGSIFDSSKKNGTATPVEFPLNAVIAGWTEGLKGAKAGSVRKLIIPADKAYGASGSGSIGPNEPLVFIVELAEVK